MKTTTIGRRDFLRDASKIGLLALAARGAQWSVCAAEGLPGGPAKDLAALEKLLAPMEEDGPRYLAVAGPDGRFLNLLVRATQARRVLELGTALGYAAIWMAMGLEETGGKITTVEMLADRLEAARQHVAAVGLSQRVTFREGDAHKIVPALAGPFEVVFLNADKDGLTDYFSKLFPSKLAPGALLVAFGAIKQREKMKPYLDLVGAHPDFDTVVVSATLEDGFAVSCRKRGRAGSR